MFVFLVKQFNYRNKSSKIKVKTRLKITSKNTQQECDLHNNDFDALKVIYIASTMDTLKVIYRTSIWILLK